MRLIDRLRVALFGRHLSDAIRSDTDVLAARAGEICAECNAALAVAAALREKFLALPRTPTPAETDLNALANVLEAFDGHETRIHDLVADFHEREQSLLARIEKLSVVCRTPVSEKVRLLGEIEAIRRPATDLHARFVQDFMSLERLWQDWSRAGQRLDRQPSQPTRRRA